MLVPCCREPCVYNLANRGFCVVTGRNEDDLGSESNGAGKSALVMAPLWALTGKSDARAEVSYVLCCGDLSCAVPSCAVLCLTMLCFAVPAVLCHTVLCCAMICILTCIISLFDSRSRCHFPGQPRLASARFTADVALAVQNAPPPTFLQVLNASSGATSLPVCNKGQPKFNKLQHPDCHLLIRALL